MESARYDRIIVPQTVFHKFIRYMSFSLRVKPYGNGLFNSNEFELNVLVLQRRSEDELKMFTYIQKPYTMNNKTL